MVTSLVSPFFDNRTTQLKSRFYSSKTICKLIVIEGRAIAQAVSRRSSTVAAPVRAQVKLCEICDEQSGTGAGFLRVLLFPLPIFILPIVPRSSSSSIMWGWYNRPISGRRTK
jgi:hypothetical protein